MATRNITLALDDEIVETGRRFAQSHGHTLNSLIRELLSRTTVRPKNDWMSEMFRLMDKTTSSKKQKSKLPKASRKRSR